MATRTWIAVLTMLGLLAAGYAMGRSMSPGPVALRSEQSRPAATAPAGLVAVTPAGKTFHHPDCKYIHGPLRMIPGKEAVAEGYTPCVRCMHAVSGE
jgi:hypothetical protein